VVTADVKGRILRGAWKRGNPKGGVDKKQTTTVGKEGKREIHPGGYPQEKENLRGVSKKKTRAKKRKSPINAGEERVMGPSGTNSRIPKKRQKQGVGTVFYETPKRCGYGWKGDELRKRGPGYHTGQGVRSHLKPRPGTLEAGGGVPNG